VGGLGGQSWGITVTNSFSNGDVTGNTAAQEVGLLVGHTGSLTADASNYSYTGDACTNSGGGGCITTVGTGDGGAANFYTPGSTPVINWDFGSVWFDNSGSSAYPTLR